MRARQAHKVPAVLHTWNTVQTAATYSAPAAGLHSQHGTEEQGMSAADLCAPSTAESGGGCEVEYRKGQNSSKKPRGQTSWQTSLFPSVCFPLSEPQVLHNTSGKKSSEYIQRQTLNCNSGGIQRDSKIFKLSLGLTVQGRKAPSHQTKRLSDT